jgi:hypothetical protein
MQYTLREISEDLYMVTNPEGQVILNHLNKPVPPMSAQVAGILCEDLNEIAGRDHQLKESLVYCMISTMMELQERQYDDMDIAPAIHWDRAFRLNPGPPQLLWEMAFLEKYKPLLKNAWVNLPLNYCSTLEEMEDGDVPKVPDNIIYELNEIIDSLSNREKFMTDLIFNFLDRFSITFSLFWVADLMDDDALLDAYYIFHLCANPDNLNHDMRKYRSHQKQRLKYLGEVKREYR